MFTVTGESMIGAGICDGDKVVVDKSIKPKHNDIVVAVVDGEYTIKRLYKYRGCIELRPENSRYQPITFTDGRELQIWGVVVGVVLGALTSLVLLFSPASMQAMQAIQPKVQFSLLRDFEPVAQLATLGFVLLAHPAVQAGTLEELIKLAQSKPGFLNCASTGPGTTGGVVVHAGGTAVPSTSNLSVTLTLTIVTIAISHIEGVRANGLIPYFKSWVPPCPPALKPALIVLEVLSQILRIVSLSVRLFANMLAGHLLIIMCIGFVILLGKLFVAPIAIPIAVAFYIFEWGLVASLQAYIFAMLSGIYIGSAIEPHH